MKNLKTKSEITKGIDHLSKVDPRVKILIKNFGIPKFPKQNNYFRTLIRAIVYQQLSGKVATIIFDRFIALYKDKDFPTPEEVLKTKVSKLRSVGLSERKAEYVLGIAKSFTEENWSPQKISKMSNDDVKEKLIQLKGIGPWTAEIFLMFTLNRPDVICLDDYGIQKGFMLFYNKRKLPDRKFMERESKKWSPYKTIMATYLWNLADKKAPFKEYS